MPPLILKEYKKILREIQGLTSKVPTEYYMAAFYEALGDTEVSESINTENADTWINSADLYEAMSKNDKFREWFLRNHYQKVGYNPTTKAWEMMYYRTKAWTDVIPSDIKHYKTTVLKDAATGEPTIIRGVPAGRYYNQRIKKEWRTGYDASTGNINLKVGVEIDNKGNFLPRADATDKKYINPEYAALDKNSAQFKLLDAIKKELMGDDGSAFQNDPEIQKAIADARAAAGGNVGAAMAAAGGTSAPEAPAQTAGGTPVTDW